VLQLKGEKQFVGRALHPRTSQKEGGAEAGCRGGKKKITPLTEGRKADNDLGVQKGTGEGPSSATIGKQMIHCRSSR